MAKNDYIPKQDTDYLAWHDQFKTNVLAQAATFGLVAGDTTPITTDNTDFHTKITNLNSTQAIARQAVADKNISRRNGEGRARALARRIKAHPAYTVALGNLLGIVGPDDGIDLSTRRPDITGNDRTGGQVEIGFNKLTSDGVNIYSKRDGDVDFIYLARDTCLRREGRGYGRQAATPYLATRLPSIALTAEGLPSIGSAKEGPLKVAGKPEIREYKAMFVLNDEEIGIFSHELVVNCAP